MFIFHRFVHVGQQPIPVARSHLKQFPFAFDLKHSILFSLLLKPMFHESVSIWHTSNPC